MEVHDEEAITETFSQGKEQSGPVRATTRLDSQVVLIVERVVQVHYERVLNFPRHPLEDSLFRQSVSNLLMSNDMT
jgi:hypothetical protein